MHNSLSGIYSTEYKNKQGVNLEDNEHKQNEE